jgi:thiol-disulfide isomerase/thioredoxin
MYTKTSKNLVLYLLLLAALIMITPLVSAAQRYVTIDFYYSSTCPSCKPYIKIMKEIDENYTGKIHINWKDFAGPGGEVNRTEWREHGFKTYPCALIENETKVPKENLTRDNLEAILKEYIDKLGVEEPVGPFQMIYYYLFVQLNPVAWMILIVFIIWVISLIFMLYTYYKKHKDNKPPDKKE